MNTTTFDRDQRVRAHAATPAARSGDVYGTVVKVDDCGLVHVRMDVSGHTVRFQPRDLIAVDV